MVPSPLVPFPVSTWYPMVAPALTGPIGWRHTPPSAEISGCDAVSASNQARFYKGVARFARAFFEVEKNAFEMAG